MTGKDFIYFFKEEKDVVMFAEYELHICLPRRIRRALLPNCPVTQPSPHTVACLSSILGRTPDMGGMSMPSQRWALEPTPTSHLLSRLRCLRRWCSIKGHFTNICHTRASSCIIINRILSWIIPILEVNFLTCSFYFHKKKYWPIKSFLINEKWHLPLQAKDSRFIVNIFVISSN